VAHAFVGPGDMLPWQVTDITDINGGG
jgi:hypothetical protein